MTSEITTFLDKLNQEYLELHTTYENLFRISYMWDHSQDKEYAASQIKLEERKSNKEYSQKISFWIKKIDTVGTVHKTALNRLLHRQYFFSLHQIPDEVKKLKEKITNYENDLQKRMSEIESGYIDFETWNFTKASRGKMTLIMRTEKNEKLRKVCFDEIQKIAKMFIKDLIQLTKRKNEFARKSWYKNFYEYKTQTEERMSSKEIFSIFDTLYDQLSPKFAQIRDLEKDMPWLRKPRNFGYMMAGDFTKQEDPYFPLETIINARGKSYTALGINYQWATMKLDLLERKWKYDNGFCHQPIPTSFIDWKKQTWQTNFTCNAIYGQIGAGSITWATLFHEGWHAAHFSNMNQQDIVLNTEYPPQSTARAETQSMFLDTMFSSIERKTRYAKTLDGKDYPFELYEKKVKKLHKVSGGGILSIASVVKFEEILYTTDENKLTEKFVLDLAEKVWLDYFDYSEPTLWILTVPHIYSRSNSCNYHGYGMATLWLTQIRKYFYDKDWYIVDNPNIGKVLTKWRNLGSSKNYNGLLQIIIWQNLNPDAFIKNVMRTENEVIETAKKRLTNMKSVPVFEGKINLNAKIYLVDGKKEISNDVDMSWEEMNKKWGEYLK